MGFQAIADGGTCNVFQPVLIVVNVEYAEKNPQLVTAFLKMYMQGIELLRTKPLEDLAPEYQTFLKKIEFGYNAGRGSFRFAQSPCFHP